MKATFENVMNTPLKKFYRGRDIQYIHRRYAMFLCSEMNPDYFWEDRGLVEIHSQIAIPS